MASEIETFCAQWVSDKNGIKPLFMSICALFESLDGVTLEYKGRPGVSHSLRAKHAAQTTRPLFVLVDVIDDEPDARWLSVCFYANLVTDAEGRGDVVPGGLLGEDACCFDIDAPDAEAFILARLREAHVGAALNR